jgi:hypothetical protein
MSIRSVLFVSASLLSLAGFGALFAAAMAQPAPRADTTQGPVFPAAKETTVAVAPVGAQYRVQSGKSGFKYVACNETRTVAGTHVEKRCLSFSPTKGWGKSVRWIPDYQLLPLR